MAPDEQHDDVASHLRAGRAKFQEGRFEAAIEEFTAALRLDQTSDQALLSKGVAYYQLGDHKKALLHFTAALEQNPENQDARLRRAKARFKAGDFIGAAEDYSEAIRIDPGNADALSQRAVTYGRLGMPIKAADDQLRTSQFSKGSTKDRKLEAAARKKAVDVMIEQTRAQLLAEEVDRTIDMAPSAELALAEERMGSAGAYVGGAFWSDRSAELALAEEEMGSADACVGGAFWSDQAREVRKRKEVELGGCDWQIFRLVFVVAVLFFLFYYPSLEVVGAGGLVLFAFLLVLGRRHKRNMEARINRLEARLKQRGGE